MNIFAMSSPVLEADFPQNVVCEGHVRYCAENGHATHIDNGVSVTWCPRCGVTHNGDTSENRRNAKHYAEEIEGALNEGKRHALGPVSVDWGTGNFAITFPETAVGEIVIEHPLTDDAALVAERAENEMLAIVMLASEAKRNGGRLNGSTKNLANIACFMIGWEKLRPLLTDTEILTLCCEDTRIARDDSPLGFGGRIIAEYTRVSDNYTLHIIPFHTLRDYS